MIKYIDKDNLEANGFIIAHNSVIIHHCRKSRRQKNETASHIHSQEQRETECVHVCAQLGFFTQIVQSASLGNGAAVGEPSRLSGHNQDNPT